MFERPLCSEEGRGLQSSSRHTIDAKGTLVLTAPHIQTVAPEVAVHICACLKSMVCLIVLRPVQNGSLMSRQSHLFITPA